MVRKLKNAIQDKPQKFKLSFAPQKEKIAEASEFTENELKEAKNEIIQKLKMANMRRQRNKQVSIHNEQPVASPVTAEEPQTVIEEIKPVEEPEATAEEAQPIATEKLPLITRKAIKPESIFEQNPAHKTF